MAAAASPEPGGSGPNWPSRSVANPRVQHAVDEVHRQVRQDDDDDDDQVDPLDHRVVALHDGVDEELTHAGDPEDPLYDDGAAGDGGHLEPQHGDHRDDG